jgi:hypothetical protein
MGSKLQLADSPRGIVLVVHDEGTGTEGDVHGRLH